MLSSEMRNLILSQLQCGKKFTQVVRDFSSVCSESTVARILLETNARKVIRKRRGPPRKIDRNMEKRIVRSLTFGKRVTTIRGAARKENVAVNTVRRMLERKRINTFKKVQRFLVTKQNGASKVMLQENADEISDSGFGPHVVGARMLYCGRRILQSSE